MVVVILVRGLLNWLYLKYELIELTVFSHAGTNSHKVKGDLKNIWSKHGQKSGCGQSGDGTLKLAVSEEWTDGINWFFVCWYRFISVFSGGHGQKQD